MSSAECLAMANKFKELKGKLAGLIGSVESCVSDIANNEENMEETVLNGRPLDDGELVEAKDKISAINDDIGVMMDECDEKYTKWMNAYKEALAREEREKKKNS